MSTGRVVNEVYVGQEPPSRTLSENLTNKVVFCNFADLPHQLEDFTQSRKFLCHGKEWFVGVFPGGIDKSSAGNVALCLYLNLAGVERDFMAKVTLRMPSYPLSRSSTYNFEERQTKFAIANKWPTIKRDELLKSNALQDGALTIFFDIQVGTDAPPVWTPKRNNLYSKMLEMFEAEDSTDVAFIVSGEHICAHRLVLKCSAPSLFALTEEGDDIPIDNIDPALFRSFLRFLYSEELTDGMKENAPETLSVADRFGCTRLKLLVESEMVSLLDSVNAADFFLLADSHSCGLLREAAFNYIMNHPTGVMQSPSWSEILKSADLMGEISKGWFSHQANSLSDNAEDRQSTGKSIVELRRLLDEKGLDVDGSRPILIKRLQNAEDDDAEIGNRRKRGRGS